MPKKSDLGQLLIDVKVNDAASHRAMAKHHGKETVPNVVSAFEGQADAVAKLYAFLRTKSISQLERLCK